MATSPFTVADYVLQRLAEQHVDTLFGVPAAYCAPLFEAAAAHGIRTVVTASDLEAGYAADGYARTRGLAAVSVAYGVGALSMINAVAGAYVERSPVVVINGGPSSAYLAALQQYDVVFSHSIGQEATDLAAYRLVTASAARAATAAEAPGVIDRAIVAALTARRPAYAEINLSSWALACPPPAGPLAIPRPPAGGEAALAATIVGLIRAAKSPLLLLGVEVQRYGLADKAAELIAKLGIRWSTQLLAKSVLPEQGAGWAGVYDPPHSAPAPQAAVENADLLVTLGCVYPNGYATLLRNGAGRIVQVYDGKVRIKGASRRDAEIGALLDALVAEAAKAPPRPPVPATAAPVPAPAAGPLTYAQVFDRIGAALDASWLVVPDTFLGIYPAANLPVKGRDGFLCGGVWASIGHSLAAAIGASFGSGRRPLVICGDGGFHMTAQALSTMVHYRRNPVIVVIANGIYGYEQYLLDPGFFGAAAKPPKPYVALNAWDFGKVAQGMGASFARTADTAAALDAALAAAKQVTDGPAIVVAQVGAHDLPAELSS